MHACDFLCELPIVLSRFGPKDGRQDEEENKEGRQQDEKAEKGNRSRSEKDRGNALYVMI